MRHRAWKSLLENLLKQMSTQEAQMIFEDYRVQSAELSPFESPIALLAYFSNLGDALDHKDELYAALIEIAQAEGKMGLATTLVFLGLWPGLNAVHRRIKNYYKHEPDEAVSVLFYHFLNRVAKADLSAINKVAATIVRNTEREIRNQLLRDKERDSKTKGLPRDDELVDPKTFKHCNGISDLGIPPGLSIDEESVRVHEACTAIVGNDADLVIAAFVYGLNHKELGVMLGLTHTNTRKRSQRIRGRIRKYLDDFDVGCPGLTPAVVNPVQQPSTF